ncbi:unnamed protein product [Symbiodinium sp. CCMP2592]|nr:unnamed protein product [Symbiodinium sp. CCMP2592]
MLGQDQSCDARARMKWAAISAGLLQVTNVQGYVVYLATSATGANRIWVSYTTASASQNGTEVEDVNASNDTAVDSDEDDSDTILYNTLTDVGTNVVTIPEGTSGRPFYTHFLVYTKSVLVEQSTPVFLTLEEASLRFVVPSLSFLDLDLDEEELGGQLVWQRPPVLGEIATYEIYLGFLDEQNHSSNKSLLVSIPSDRVEYDVPPNTPANETTHLLIHTASETVEHRTPAFFEFFDAIASATGLTFTDLDLDVNELGGVLSWVPPPVKDQVDVYQLFFSEDADGNGRSQFGFDIMRGATALEVASQTPLNGYTHFVLYTKSSLVRQSTPAALLLSDTIASVANISFPDEDLDALEIGGFISWDNPKETTYVTEYMQRGSTKLKCGVGHGAVQGMRLHRSGLSTRAADPLKLQPPSRQERKM